MSVNNYDLMKELGRQHQQKLLTEAANERRVRNAQAQQRPGRLRNAILGTPSRKLAFAVLVVLLALVVATQVFPELGTAFDLGNVGVVAF